MVVIHQWCFRPDGVSHGAALQQLAELCPGEDAAMIYHFNISTAHRQVRHTLCTGESHNCQTNRAGLVPRRKLTRGGLVTGNPETT